jgi:phosphoglycolate phosphatase-like HAD superfamily hydrolase
LGVEQIRPGASASGARVALFDFDGTLSLIRSGWMDVMVPMMVEILVDLRTGESEQHLRGVVEEFVWRLTGKETIYQMMEFAEHVRARGGQAKSPLEYKKMYLERLWTKIRSRIEALEKGHASPEQYLVPGVRALVERLKDQGLKLYLASGTDHANVVHEAGLLDMARYFDGGVYGAQDDLNSFSKKILVQRIIANTGVAGSEILGFGDGYVEIEEVKLVGGVAVGVATKEPACQEIDEWKRQRLIGVGADFIVPNFTGHAELAQMLFS